MKSGEDFKKSSKENNIHCWQIHDCSFCSYRCSYLFDFRGYEIVYDSGCHCTGRRVLTEKSWDDVAKQYNLNLKNKETIKRYNEFWKFKD
jgi:hypothetical protein